MAVPLTLKQVMGVLNSTFRRLPEQRRGQNSQYTMQDAALSAFGVFFTQSPSFLAYQRAMQRGKGTTMPRGCSGSSGFPAMPRSAICSTP